MHSLFERLTALALDPFAQQNADPLALALSGEFPSGDLLSSTQAQRIANGPWSRCEGCCDPGPDEFPEQSSPSTHSQ